MEFISSAEGENSAGLITTNMRIKVKAGLTFYTDIVVSGSFDEEQWQGVLHIAKAGPISRLLQKENEVITNLETGGISVIP